MLEENDSIPRERVIIVSRGYIRVIYDGLFVDVDTHEDEYCRKPLSGAAA